MDDHYYKIALNIDMIAYQCHFKGVASPKGDWKPEEVATVGELMLDMSIQLART